MPRRWTMTLEGIQALSRERSRFKENATTCRNGVLLEVTINGVGAEIIPAVKLLRHCFQSGSKRSNGIEWPVYYKCLSASKDAFACDQLEDEVVEDGLMM
jgi:hypothetical protein